MALNNALIFCPKKKVLHYRYIFRAGSVFQHLHLIDSAFKSPVTN